MGKSNCFLSKCRYLNGVKCLKLSWYECNNPGAIPKPDAQTQAIFNWGHFIGEKAKAYFPGGVENTVQDFNCHLQTSLAWLKRKIPLFEVAYMADNLYARPDVIRPNDDGSWDIIEVKCNTEIHEINVRDIAYQHFVLTRAGLKIKNLFLMHPKPEIKVGRGSEPAEIFVLDEVTCRAAKYLPELAENVRRIRVACAQKEPPDIEIGEQCEKPYKCPMFQVCGQATNRELTEIEELQRQKQIFDADSVEKLIRLAMEFCVDNLDAQALQALRKAMSYAEFPSEFCNLAITFHELKLSDHLRDMALREALKVAKVPADFEEIARTERQIAEVRYVD